MAPLHFRWTRRLAARHLLSFRLLAQKENAPLAREAQREAPPNPQRKPWAPVG